MGVFANVILVNVLALMVMKVRVVRDLPALMIAQVTVPVNTLKILLTVMSGLITLLLDYMNLLPLLLIVIGTGRRNVPVYVTLISVVLIAPRECALMVMIYWMPVTTNLLF